MLTDLEILPRQTGARGYLWLTHLAMRMDRPEAQSTGRLPELAKQRSPGPPVQESELGHRTARGWISKTRGKGPKNKARRTPERVQRAVEMKPEHQRRGERF